VLAAGCGGGAERAASPVDALPGGTILFQGGGWAVVTKGARAVAAHLLDGRWEIDRSRRVRLRILGPRPGGRAPRLPQVAIAIDAPAALAESALWVDGAELLEKGGGSATRATIYGAPAKRLRPGRHVAVGYARTASTGTAVAWAFTV
jgi:hypothetical protein